MSIRNLDSLFDPRSVAVFGASRRHESVGGIVLRNLRSAGFAGPVHAVNPSGGEIDGVATYASIALLPEVPDLALICTPPETIPTLIAQLGAAGTRAAVVVTAGLGAALTQQMLSAAKPHLLRILGPNCIGLMSPRQKLNATFAHTDALAGELAFVTQSGALLTAMLDWAKTRGIGFSRLVSLGERADVDLGDMLDYLASDAHTRAILLYVESIEAPRKFMSAARAAARNKPVIVVKAGRAGKGVQAAASHTGALALLRPPGLHHDHRFVARRSACRRHELARRLDRFDVQQDGAGLRVARQVVEQVAEVDIGVLAQRHEVRKADRACAGPVEHGGHQGTRLRHEREFARQRIGMREARVQPDMRCQQPDAVRAQDAQQVRPCRVQHGCLLLGAQAGSQDHGGARAERTQFRNQACDRGRGRADHGQSGNQRQICRVCEDRFTGELAVLGIHRVQGPIELSVSEV